MNTTAVMSMPFIAADITQTGKIQSEADAGFQKLLINLLGVSTEPSGQMTGEGSGQVSPEQAAGLIIDALTGKLSLQECAEALSLSETDSSAVVKALEHLVSGLMTASEEAADGEAAHCVLTGAGVSSVGEGKKTEEQISSDIEEPLLKAAALMLELISIFQGDTTVLSEDASKSDVKIVQLIIPTASNQSEKEISVVSDSGASANTQSVKLSEALSRLNELISQIKDLDGQQMVTVSVESEGVAESQSEASENKLFPMKIIHKTAELEELTAAASFNLSEVQRAVGEASLPVDQAPVEEQLTEFISEQLIEALPDNSATKLTMTLKPEALGELSIEIVKKGTELTVTIAAKEAVTQKLIEEKLPMLMASLSTGENEVKSIQVVPAQENNEALLNQQYSSQDYNQNRSGQFSGFGMEALTKLSEESQSAFETAEQEYKEEGILWQTV